LDVQGGSGADAAWLASLGHHVTVYESSAAQRQYAEERFSELAGGAGERITLKEGLLPEGELAPTDRYDLVLCHGVAMYQKNPDNFLAQTASFVKKDGLLSVLEPGYFGVKKAALQNGQSSEQLMKFCRTQWLVNGLGLERYTFRPQQLEATLKKAGMQVLRWSGVRVTPEVEADYRRIDRGEVTQEELAVILTEEYRCSESYARRGEGKMLHFIARKQEAH
jgi:SAM-dependent methyltransferase